MESNVKSFEEACARLGISTDVPDVSAWPENLQKHMIATYKLSKILEVNNGDWKPKIADTNQWKYYPWFRVLPGEGSSGFGLSYYDYDYVDADTCHGVRLACKDAELARFMGDNFTELYKDLFA